MVGVSAIISTQVYVNERYASAWIGCVVLFYARSMTSIEREKSGLKAADSCNAKIHMCLSVYIFKYLKQGSKELVAFCIIQTCRCYVEVNHHWFDVDAIQPLIENACLAKFCEYLPLFISTSLFD